MKISKSILLYVIAVVGMAMVAYSCSDSKSYAERLTDENKNVNAFLANHRVINNIPADSIFETGEDAPYYRMDNEGNVYMQVLDAGDKEKPETDDMVYFRYMRYDLTGYAQSDTLGYAMGNAEDMDYPATWFRLNNFQLSSSAQYGVGIQIPMNYLGWNAEVNIVIKSQYGFTSEMSYVSPFLYNIRYFKPGV